MNQNNKVKHPKGLTFLFLSEMWERFGYYLMIGIFTLYLKDVKAGFAMTEAEAADLYGTFIALVFLTPFLGGLIADRYFGYTKSIIIGGLMMGVGYCMMAIHSLPILYLSMTLVIIGNGFFKPNISTLLGNIYSTPEYEDKKDEGYNIFYMGINVGAFICNFFGAALYILLGWGYAFLAAGIGMFLGVGIFLYGMKHYRAFDVKKGMQQGDMSFLKIVMVILFPAVIAGVIGWVVPTQVLGHALIGSPSTDAFIFACIPVIYFYGSLLAKADKSEKRPIAALLTIFAVVILFWAVFKQNGSALNTWADRYTDRHVENPMAAKIFSGLSLSQQLTMAKDSVPLYDEAFRLQKADGKVLQEYNYPTYFKNVAPEKRLAEGTQIEVWATNISQSINPGWVILLTPLIVAFFTWLRKRNQEPTTATKIAFGLLISALSVLVMIGAVYSGGNGAEKVSVFWLMASYGVITIGELFLSPMGLSLVSKLSPVRITSLMMGGWFLATSIGNKLSGVLATLWDTYENKANFFWINFFLLLFSALVAFMLLKWLNGIMREKGIK
ncbi:peptide MFS transporter [Pedobacter antarcticus]|uniref:Amino acid transporter n=2 Tax=Pedobacter antarcticus TaxID=34086 RepID=A0A081PKU0_9SPHI|nr:peptide MFS transporter [Pedobacter antarcticus]KEQ31313.1 amino acid transporter [Pedobacter antarcticus 4BY]SDM60068.1 proton-dependent oligopeptide transporter, POT family [Pedobacter antarcticus]SFE58283.1 proton-dependent oligopeptide transporter, POT family [Pedobacter antarcticus]